MIDCPQCGLVPVPRDQLPVVLPEVDDYAPKGQSPLALAHDWVRVACPDCGGEARRETDTMDTFVDSSWYFFRYADPHNDRAIFDRDKAEYWMPLDQYIGGVEHAILHLLYARFVTKFLYDIGLSPVTEPFMRMFTQGMLVRDGAKMSKSKGNVVDPTEMCARYGADTVRLYMLFAAPPEKDLEWSDAGIEGASRFLNKVYRLVAKHTERLRGVTIWNSTSGAGSLSAEERRLLRKTHQSLRHVSADLEERWHYNTDIAMMMELVNEIADLDGSVAEGKIRPEVLKTTVESLLVMLSPFAPHVADELWEALGRDQPLLRTPWPAYNDELAAEEELEIPVQVNGKLRGRVRVPAGATEEVIRTRALAEEKVAALIDGKQIVKVIVVPQKLVNIVVK
jgi:leucyl-tRNA synthetase